MWENYISKITNMLNLKVLFKLNVFIASFPEMNQYSINPFN